MTYLTLSQFLMGLGWTEPMKNQIMKTADNLDVSYIAAFKIGETLKAAAFPELPEEWPENCIGVWARHPVIDVKKSKTMQALDLVDQGMSRYAAAKQLDISESAVHRAWHRRQGKDICPTCNQIIQPSSA
jgi:hypothetical protein